MVLNKNILKAVITMWPTSSCPHLESLVSYLLNEWCEVSDCPHTTVVLNQNTKWNRLSFCWNFFVGIKTFSFTAPKVMCRDGISVLTSSTNQNISKPKIHDRKRLILFLFCERILIYILLQIKGHFYPSNTNAFSSECNWIKITIFI